MSAVGALRKVRVNQVQQQLAGIFVAPGIPATFVGTAVGKHPPQHAIMPGFAIVMISAGMRTLRGTTVPDCRTLRDAVAPSGIDLHEQLGRIHVYRPLPTPESRAARRNILATVAY